MIGLLVCICALTESYAWAQEVHVVAKGHTLGKIAKRYHVSVADLRRVNGLESNVIRPGMKLVIPTGDADKAGKLAARMKTERDADERTKKKAQTAKKAEVSAQKAARAFEKKPPKAGRVRFRHHGEGALITLVRKGKVRTEALGELARILRHRSNQKAAIDPELARLIAQVSDHFGGRTLHVVSGYRPQTPDQYTAHSRHNTGQALDFTVEGVPTEVVRDYCLTLPRAGVGYYPVSGFIHLDTRPLKHAWIDESGPGERPRYVQRVGEGASDRSKMTSSATAQDSENKHGIPDGGGPDGPNTKSNGHSVPTPPAEASASPSLAPPASPGETDAAQGS